MNLNLFPKDLLVELDAAGQPYTTSLAVAQAFGKNHQHIMRDIETLLANLGELTIGDLHAIAEENHFIPDVNTASKFGRSQYKFSSNNRHGERPMYRLYRDAFILLVMSYTGRKALLVKVRFLAAFNTMEELLIDRFSSYENALTQLRPNLIVVAEHPDMSRQALAELLGYKSLDSVTRARRRARELGLLGEQS